MSDVGSVKYQVELDNSKLDRDVGQTESTITSKLGVVNGAVSVAMGQMLANIGTAFIEMGKQAVSAFVDISKAALESTAAFEQNVGGIETLFGAGGQSLEEYAQAVGQTTEEAKGKYEELMQAQELALKNAEQAYKTAGMSANEYMSTATSVAAAMKQSTSSELEAAQAVDQMIVDMADNANKMGTDMSAIQTAYQGFSKQNYTMLDNLKLGYGGTKTEMERLIADANAVKVANGEMADLSIESFADVTEAIHIIQTEMGITGTTAKEAAATIEGSMNSAKAAWDNFLNGSISGEELMETVVTAAENIATNLATIIDNFAQQIPGMIQVVTDALPGLVQTLGPPILNALHNIAQALVPAGGELIMMLAQGLTANLPTMIEGAVQAIQTLADGLIANLPTILNTGLEILFTLATGLVQAIPDLVETAYEIVGALYDYLLQNGPKILESGFKLIVELAAGLIKAIPKAVDGSSKIIQKIIDKFRSTNWGDVGRAIVEGIANGIRNLGGVIADAARSVAQGALNAAKSFLGIASPSKVFRREVGEQIPAGMAEGIEDGEDVVDESIEKLTGRTVDVGVRALPEMVDALLGGYTADLRLPDVSGYADQMGAAISATTSMTITVPVSIDGREVARATAWYTNEQLAWEAR